MADPKFITVTKDGQSQFQIDPSEFQAARQKGYRIYEPPSDFDKQSFGDKLTSGYNPGAQGHNPLIRGLDAVGGAALGFVPSIYNAFAQPPSPQEQEQYKGHIEAADSGNMAKDYAGRVMLGGERLLGKPVVDSAQQWLDPKTRPSWQQVKSVLPEALGVGAGNVMAGDISREVGQRLNKIRTGSYSDAVNELERYRRTTNSIRASKNQKLIAEKYHAAMRERMNIEWDNLYKHLEGTPTDALAITKALEPLAKRDPVYAKWLETNIVESKSGESVTVPLWNRVRELSKKMNEDLADPSVDRTIKAEIEPAHTALEKLLADAADRQGLKQQYTRAYSLNRKVMNIMQHTALESTKNKPSPLWGLGGMFTGMAVSSAHGMSGSSQLGGAFIGGAAGKFLGDLVTKKDSYTVPKLSRQGEAGFWRELGEDAPAGTGGKTIRTGKPVKHYDRGAAHAAKVSKMTKEGRPVSGGSQGAGGPWDNLEFDRQAEEQAIKERDAGQLPQGMSLVQRAQQIKEQLMSGKVKGSFQSGTAHVPETGTYTLHKGEAVIPANANPMSWLGPASQANPMRGNVFSDAADSWVSGQTAKIPGPGAPTVGSEHAARLMAHYNDLMRAMSLLGVKPPQPKPAPKRPKGKTPKTDMWIEPMPEPKAMNLV